jgi:DNA-binding SARP family transcriptional activator
LVQVGILGPLDVRDAAGGAVNIAGSRLRAVLVRLALDAGRPVSVGTLVDAVWTGVPPTDEANALQTLMSRLRRVLPEPGAVVQSAAGYRLAIDREDVDAHRFQTLALAGAAALRDGAASRAADLLHQALALWRAPELDDLERVAPGQARRLRELRLAAVVDRLDAELQLGRAAAVCTELEGLCGEHPLNERLAGQLVTALAATGRQAEALAGYERLRTRLADELGVDPCPALQAIHLAVLRGEAGAALPAPAAVRRTNLRAQLTSFVGRDA